MFRNLYLYCVRCGDSELFQPSEPFCGKCSHELEFLKSDSGDASVQASDKMRIRSAIEFEKVRDLLIAAKVGCDVGSLRAISCLVRKYVLRNQMWFSQFDRFASVPQSFYSKILGRFNVAEYISEVISLECRRSVLRVRSPFFWRVRKQSFKKLRSRREQNTHHFRLSECDAPELRVLLIDDVITSGATFSEVSKAFPRDWKIEGFAFASAR